MESEKIQEICEQMKKSMQEHEARIEILVRDAELRAANTLRDADESIFKETIKQCYLDANKSISETAAKLAKKSRNFLWEKFLIGFVGAILGILVTNLYLNDEWPWELHHRVMEERLIGAAVIKNWDQLNTIDRHKILDTMDKKSQQEIFQDLHLKFSQTNLKS